MHANTVSDLGNRAFAILGRSHNFMETKEHKKQTTGPVIEVVTPL